MILKPGKNIRLFKNPVLEKLTYVHPAVPILLWGPLSAFFFVWSSRDPGLGLGWTTVLFLAGLVFWTFAEYTLHRFLFHFRPSPESPLQQRIQFLIHGIHHTDPGDQRRLLMPPSAALILAVLFYSLFRAALGTVLYKGFFSGFLVGYLIYDYIHFATHYLNPKARWLKQLKVYHLRHHFTHLDGKFGVSNPLWDYVFRTTS